MQSTRHDPRVAALHARAGLPGHVVDVVVLTADAGLLATLRAASGQEHAIWHAPTADAAVDLLVGGRCGVLIGDLEILRGDHSLLGQLQNQFPELVLLATGRREEEQRVAALVTSGAIYRFLHKPVSPARASLFLSTATRRYNELRNIEPAAAGAGATNSPQLGWLKFALVTLVAIATLVGVWVALRQPSNDQQLPPEARSTGTNAEHELADLLGHAQMAYAADRLSEPRGNNALQYFRAALALDPRSVDAHTGIERVLRTLEGRVTEALAARDAKRGAVALTALQRAAPDHPRIESLRAQLVAISRARPPEITTPAVPQRTTSSPVAEPAPLATPNIDAARTRIETAALTEPAGESALASLRQARQREENDSLLRIVASDAASRALALADEAIAAGNQAQAERRLVEAQLFDREFELTLPGIEAVAQRLQGLTSAREAVAVSLAAAMRLRERGRLIEPPGENAYERMLVLRAQSPDSAEVRDELQRLASAMVERTRTALAAGNADEAGAYLKHADALAPDKSAVRSLERQVAAAREASDFRKNVVPAVTLPQTRKLAPRYPAASERVGIEGYVDVEFTVATDGTTRDFIVTGAQPANVFDKAAVDAVSEWRFKPVMKNGSAVAQRAAVRVRFALH